MSRSSITKIVMLTNDRKIDRRILLQAQSLREAGYEVVIIAMVDDATVYEPQNVIAIQNDKGKKFGEDIYFRIYKKIRDKISRYPFLQKRLREISWVAFWLKCCIKEKKILAQLPQEIFFNTLFFEKALSEAGDIYVAHDLPMLSTAAACAKASGAKLLYDSHELYPEQQLGYFEKKIWSALEKKYIKSPHQVITVNTSIANEMARRYQIKAPHVIYNAEQLPASPPSSLRLFHDYFKLTPTKQILLFQGGFSSDRNLLNLVLAMREVRNKNVCLIMLGDGYYLSTLKRIVAKYQLDQRVFFHPMVSQKELLNYTQSADIGIIPYQATCMNNYLCTPNKLFEFIIAGLPILANDLPEIRNIVANQEIGLVAQLNSSSRIAYAIDAIFNDQVTLDKYKQKLAHARLEFNWQNEAKKIINIYQSL